MIFNIFLENLVLVWSLQEYCISWHFCRDQLCLIVYRLPNKTNQKYLIQNFTYPRLGKLGKVKHPGLPNTIRRYTTDKYNMLINVHLMKASDNVNGSDQILWNLRLLE